jgi:uncharacterized protein (DUF1499 family)
VFIFIAATLVVLPLGLLAVLSGLAQRPSGLGAHGRRLADCPATPNCVSSAATAVSHRVAPLACSGDATAAMARLAAVLQATPRMAIITQADGYMHAEATSRIFRFVDDMEFLLDPEARVLHVRSASRVGRSDFGANRARVERIRQALR